jgi:hypothetical protein
MICDCTDSNSFCISYNAWSHVYEDEMAFEKNFGVQLGIKNSHFATSFLHGEP